MKRLSFALSVLTCLYALSSCKQLVNEAKTPDANTTSLLKTYAEIPDTAFRYEWRLTIDGDGFKTYVLYLQSQRWLTSEEVNDPLWWHWLTIVVPEQVKSEIGLLFIGGGSKNSKMPEGPSPLILGPSLATQTVAAYLHNVPNQPLVFERDTFGPREEDEIIALGWRKYIEGGAKPEDAKWLSRLPMTKSAVSAMDAVTAFCRDSLKIGVNKFTVMGASKRGWTTWTTAAVDKRVVAIAPIVIDLLNLVPSFQHHWQTYGFWAPAVNDYVREGIMEQQHSAAYQQLLNEVEPYTFRQQLSMPKYMINATGDQFFLPDSWQFYWKDLIGEKHIRYIPNADHSLKDTDALQGFIPFYFSVVNNEPRPDFNWSVEDGAIHLQTLPAFEPDSILLWSATNPEKRDFRLETIGKSWTSKRVDLKENGQYQLNVETPESGWRAFFAELYFKGLPDMPFKFTTGVVVVPDSLPFPPFESNAVEQKEQ